MHTYCVYTLINEHNTGLYVGATNNLERHVMERKASQHTGFANQYHLIKLTYYETSSSVMDAIGREKPLKAGSRAKS